MQASSLKSLCEQLSNALDCFPEINPGDHMFVYELAQKLVSVTSQSTSSHLFNIDRVMATHSSCKKSIWMRMLQILKYAAKSNVEINGFLSNKSFGAVAYSSHGSNATFSHERLPDGNLRHQFVFSGNYPLRATTNDREMHDLNPRATPAAQMLGFDADYRRAAFSRKVREEKEPRPICRVPLYCGQQAHVRQSVQSRARHITSQPIAAPMQITSQPIAAPMPQFCLGQELHNLFPDGQWFTANDQYFYLCSETMWSPTQQPDVYLCAPRPDWAGDMLRAVDNPYVVAQAVDNNTLQEDDELQHLFSQWDSDQPHNAESSLQMLGTESSAEEHNSQMLGTESSAEEHNSQLLGTESSAEEHNSQLLGTNTSSWDNTESSVRILFPPGAQVAQEQEPCIFGEPDEVELELFGNRDPIVVAPEPIMVAPEPTIVATSHKRRRCIFDMD